MQSDNQSDGDEGSVGAKRKGPMSEEDRKRRRQEINRQSARRIREKKSLEVTRLKQQVQHVQLSVCQRLRMSRCSTPLLLVSLQNAALQQSQTLLLNYASSLAREKTVLVQRTLELTERWNQVQYCSSWPKNVAVIQWPLLMSALPCNLCCGDLVIFAIIHNYTPLQRYC